MRGRVRLFAALAAFLGAALPVAAAGGPGEPARDDHTLRLAEFAFDPLLQEPALPPGWDRSLTAGPDLQLVQFDGPIPADASARLNAAGLAPVRYVYPNTYIVWGQGADRDALRGQPRIRWTGEFVPAYRVRAALRDRSKDLLDVRVLIYRGAGADAVIAALSKLGLPTGSRTVVDDTLEIAGFRIPGSLMRFAAAVPGVYSIQPLNSDWASRAELSSQINVANLDPETGFPIPGYRNWLAAVGLDGAGVNVAIVDEGVDQSHPDLAAGRLPCTGITCTDAPSTHGSHVAGVVTGDGISGALDANGFLRGLGVAPGTRYLEQEFVLFRFLPAGVTQLIRDSGRNGATISNNSWGTSTTAEGYDADTLLIDAGVRDVDPARPGNQELFYVQAIDNGNGGISSQGTPDEAKNVFVVGSTRASDLSGNPIDTFDDLSANTAHGPALDGRTIPHLVAPGCHVDSTIPDFGGGYGFQLICGTSMAAPQISGAAALFTQHYRRLPDTASDPSPALIKAALLAVGRDLQGQLDADGTTLGHRPDSKQGWGRLDLRALVQPPPGSVIYYDQERVFVETGEEDWLREVVPADPGEPMRVMLAWTDAPGHGLGGSTPAWNNDLDLLVEMGGSTYRGNFFGVDGWSATGGSADLRNNAEGVFLPVPAGRVTIRVRPSNINSDGVPNFGDRLDQDFALVCVNCAYAEGFDLEPAPVTRGVCAPQSAVYEVNVASHAGYAKPVTLSLAGVPAGASAGFDVNPVVSGGKSVLTVAPGAVADGKYKLTLTGIAAEASRVQPLYLEVRRAAPAGAAPSVPVNGAVNVALQPVLEWTAATSTVSYVVELSTDPTFRTIFYSAVSESTLHKVGVTLAEATLYHWRVRARNVCGFGAFSASSSFTTRDVPPVLLVDDDWDLNGDFQAEYRAALDALPLAPYFYPVSYDVWDVHAVHQQQEPDAADLAAYEKVIWWSAKEDYYAGPEYFGELELSTWFVRRGGCLMLSSADYVLSRRGVSDFMRERLGVASVIEDTRRTTVTGRGSVFGGLGPFTLQASSPDWSDAVSPDATAEIAFSGDGQKAGIDKQGSYYRTSFLGYGLERLSATDRPAVMRRFLQWCDGLTALDGDGDGVANGTDCVPGDASAWGVPGPVTDLALSRDAIGFRWSQPVGDGGAVYDLLRSGSPADFWNASCVASGLSETSVPASWDTDPAPGAATFYLVRVRSDCGTAPMGSASDGTPRQGTACQ